MRSFSSTIAVSRSFLFASTLSLLAAVAVGCAEEMAPAAANPGGVGPGTGGSGTGTLPDVAGCTAATAVAGAEIGIATDGFKYTPACLQVKVGSVVTFKGGGALHPLAPMTKGSTANNPIPLSKEAEVAVTFAGPGVFPFFCENHGSDGGTSNMVGAVYVVP